MISLLTRPLAKAYGEEKAFQILAAAGFEGVDYSMHLHPLASPLYDLSRAQVTERFNALKGVMSTQGLTVCQLHTLYPTYTGKTEEDVRRFRATLTGIWAAQVLGSPYAVVHPILPDVPLNARGREVGWELNRRFYSRLIPSLRECGVQLGIENMFSFVAGGYQPNILSTGEDMTIYIDRLNDIAGEELFVACLDTGHAHLLGLNLSQMVIQLGKRLHLLHLHDNRGTGDDHTAPYVGTLDWKALLTALRGMGYSGNISLECHGFIENFPVALMPEAVTLLACIAKCFEGQIKVLPPQIGAEQ